MTMDEGNFTVQRLYKQNKVQQKRIEELKAENEKLKKWQIKPTEAICLTDLACRYKKVFKSD